MKFAAGEHGSFAEGTKTSWALAHGETYPTAPVPVAESEDWLFNGWDKAYPEGKTVTIEENAGADEVTYTAQWTADLNHDDKPDADQKLTVKFAAGEHGSFAEGTKTSWALAHGELYPTAPVPVAESEDWLFNGWDKAYPEGKTVTIEENAGADEVTYTAQWTADLNHDDKPDADQKLTITFSAGAGSFKANITTSYILLPGEAYPVAPGADNLNAPEGYAFSGWSPEYDLTGTVPEGQTTETRTYIAVYGEDTNHNNQPDEDESYSLTITYAYAQGEEGSAALPAVNRQNDLAVGHAYSVASPEIEGYVAGTGSSQRNDL